MSTKKVSVIVPVYNLEKYIGECIESLITQKTDFEFEIIALDDSSDDKSYELMKALESEYPQLLSVHRNDVNRGLATTMRRLIGLTTGEYIAYLDGDDLALPGKLQQQANYLDKNPSCAIVYHDSEVFDSQSGKRLSSYTSDYYNFKYIPQQATVEHVIKYGCFMQASTVMVRRYESITDSVDGHNKILHDHPWHLMNLINTKGTIDLIDQTLGRYRIHPDSFGAQTLRSAERREQVLADQLHVCHLAEKAGIDLEIVRQGESHYYFATAMYFLKQGDNGRFEYFIARSSDGNWFFDERHKDMWENPGDNHRLRTEYA